MAEIEVKIEDLRDFRFRLIRFNQTLTEEFHAMLYAWDNVRETWTDPMAERYGKALDEASAGIEQYLRGTDKHEAYLERLIERFQAAVDERMGL